MLPGLFLLPAGLFWYGWSAERHYHWVVVDIGVAVFTTGNFIVSSLQLLLSVHESTLKVLSLLCAWPLFLEEEHGNTSESYKIIQGSFCSFFRD